MLVARTHDIGWAHCSQRFTDELRPRGGFILAETLVHNGIAGGNGTAGGTLNQPVLGFLLGWNPLWAMAFRPVNTMTAASTTACTGSYYWRLPGSTLAS